MKKYFDEYLDNHKADQLKKIARIWGGEGNERKQENIDLIKAGLGNSNKVKNVMARLQPYQRVALSITKYCDNHVSGKLLITTLHSSGVALPRPTSRHREGDKYLLQALFDSGLILKIPEKRWVDYSSLGYDYGQTSFFSDERLLAQIEANIPCEPVGIKPTDQQHPSVYRRTQVVVLDVINLIETIRTTGSLELVKSGKIKVSSLRKLNKALGWKDGSLEMDGLIFPNAIKIFVNVLSVIGILVTNGSEIVLGKSADEFTKYPPQEQIQQLLRGFSIASKWTDDSKYELDIYQSGCIALVNLLKSLPTNTDAFFDVNDFDLAMFSRIGQSFSFGYVINKPYYFRESAEDIEQQEMKRLATIRKNWLKRERVWFEQILSSWFYYLGIVEIQLYNNKPVAIRLTQLGQAVLHPKLNIVLMEETASTQSGPTWVIQPNFEIVVYLERATPEQLIFLEQHAERMQVQQHVAQYRLTRDSVYQGLEKGTEVDVLISELKAGMKNDLPQNVLIDLQEWGALRDQMTLYYKTNLLEFPDEAAYQNAVRGGVKGKLVGSRYMLVENYDRDWAVQTIDYNFPLPRCLSINENGLIKVNQTYSDLLLEAQLNKWAEQKTKRIWQLTEESISNAVKAKVRIDELLDMLNERLLVKRLPSMLKITLQAWSGKKFELDMSAITLIRCTNHELYKAITNSRKLRPYIKGCFGDDLMLVDSNYVELLHKELSWAGLKISDEITFE
jgi:hypothetical protein